MAAAKPAVPPFRVNMERIQIPRAKIGGAGRNNPANQLPVDSPPPRASADSPLKEQEDESSEKQAKVVNRGENKKEKVNSPLAAPKIVVSKSPPPPEPAIDYD